MLPRWHRTVIAKGSKVLRDYGPAMEAWLDAPNGIAVAPNGDLYIADSNNDVIRRVDTRNNIVPVAGSHDLGTGFSGDNGPAIVAQLDTPDGVAIAPDGDLIVADSHNDASAASSADANITTIAGSGENGYDGDDTGDSGGAQHAERVAAAPNGDIYIADTLNYRIRMIAAKTGLIHTVAATAGPAIRRRGRRRARDQRALNMPSDVAIDPEPAISTSPICITTGCAGRREDKIITTIAAQRRLGKLRRRWAGDPGESSRDGPRVAVVNEPGARSRYSLPTSTTAMSERSVRTASCAISATKDAEAFARRPRVAYDRAAGSLRRRFEPRASVP